MREDYEDWGKELNLQIRERKARINDLRMQLTEQEHTLESLQNERTEAMKECGHCDDCSMCLG